MPKIFAIVLFLFPGVLFSQTSYYPASFPVRGFTELPFSKQELSVIKEKGISRLVASESPTGLETVYYFNPEGKLIYSEQSDVSGKRAKITASCHYRYNNAGQLIIKHLIVNKYENTYDSIAYDSVGRIIYATSMSFRKSRLLRRADTLVDFEFTFFYAKDSTIVLVDSTTSLSHVTCELSNNEVIAVEDKFYIHSITKEEHDSSAFSIKYTCLNKQNGEKYVRTKSHFEDQLLREEVRYFPNSSMVMIIRHYHYDEKGRLLRIEDQYGSWALYTYYPLIDFKSREISFFGNETIVIFYTPYF